MSDFIECRVGNYDCVSGYLFSTDIMSTMDKYHNDAADRLIETAKNMCKDHVNDVSAKRSYHVLSYISRIQLSF